MRSDPSTSRPWRRAPLGVGLATAVVVSALFAAIPASATAGDLTVTTLGTLTAEQLAQDLAGDGVTVSNVTYVGVPTSAGSFSDTGTPPDLILGLQGGVVLSSGNAGLVTGPNDTGSAGASNGTEGDADLAALVGGADTFDATSLSFDFVPDASSISFRFVFASEEYNEYVGAGVDDVFGFFINGTNCAMVGSDRISIDTINLTSHASLFRDNEGGAINTQMDGLTTVLSCTASVAANEPNHMKLAIADVGDSVFDSDVFIEAGSLTTEPPGEAEPPGAPTSVHAIGGDGSALVTWTPPADDGGASIDRFDATCTATENAGDVRGASAGGGDTTVQVTGLTNGTEYRCVVSAHNEAGSGPDSEPSEPITPGASSTSQEVDPAAGGTIDLSGTLGTSARMVLPAQDAAGPPVTATMSLFGTPGEVDATCGGNACIGQGIEWGLSDPTAFKRIRIIFFEDPSLVVGHDLQTAPVYKDGIAIGPCVKVNGRRVPPCVEKRKLLKDGRWKITVVATGEDPKGRI